MEASSKGNSGGGAEDTIHSEWISAMNGLSGLQVQMMQQFKSEVFDQRLHVLEELTGVAERSELHDVTHVPEHGPSSHMQVTDQTSELLLMLHVKST